MGYTLIGADCNSTNAPVGDGMERRRVIILKFLLMLCFQMGWVDVVFVVLAVIFDVASSEKNSLTVVF
jgi:hypothetical protein